MPAPEQKPDSQGLQRDVLSRERFATVTCPSCQATLKVKASVPAAAPCPNCNHPLRYDPPTEAPQQPAFVPKQRIQPDQTKVVQTPAPHTPAPQPEPDNRSLFGKFNDFLNSPSGITISWSIVAILVTACVFLFFQWEKQRRDRTLHMESLESQRPPASRPVDREPIPLLPGEPEPVDPLKLPE